jgi:hypothetical protein
MNNIEKDLEYWRKNAEEDYLHVPISVLKYISELEMEIKEKEDLIEAFEVGYGSGISELGTNYYTETFE